MERLTVEDGVARSVDVIADNLTQLRALFPEAFTEAKVDFDVLRQLLGDQIDDGDEKYGLNWHGKRKARQLALTPSTGTLRPCPEDSVDWDTTQNLMIEGDNLEVLKLLQKSYSGKVKLIYIDPPYNTGKDFVYTDNFRDNITNYLEITSQTEGGAKLTSNTESSGRFHTDWLNMMYPRLKLARNLLRDDGVIFISIDDGELNNLLTLCDEILGEENLIACFIWEKRTNRENRKVVSSRHDYIVCYCRDSTKVDEAISSLPMSDEALERYKNPDSDPRGPWKSDPASAQAGHGTKAQFYVLTAPNGKRHEPQSGRCWVYTEPVMNEAIQDGRIWFGRDGNGVPRIKTYLNAKERGLVPESIWFAKEASTNEAAKNYLKMMFSGQAVFDTPKPVELMRLMLKIACDDGIVVDFFAGSGATAESVVSENSLDAGKRRFILVQLPEPLDPEDSDQTTAALFCDSIGKPRNIAELTKERLRRVGAKVKEQNPPFAGDLGFRVFRLDASNFRAWQPDPGDLDQTLLDNIDHVEDGRSEQDVLYELLLKLGLDLCVPIEARSIAGKTVHSIGAGTLIVCLDEAITRDTVESLALGIAQWHKVLNPAGDTTIVFRDSAFVDDVPKTNLTAILEQHGLETVRSI